MEFPDTGSIIFYSILTYRNQQTLRLSTHAPAAKERAQSDQYADAEENVEGYMVMIVGLCHGQHERGICQHPDGGDHDGQTDELQAKSETIKNIYF